MPESFDLALASGEIVVAKGRLDGKLEQRTAGRDEGTDGVVALGLPQFARIRTARLDRHKGLRHKPLVFLESPQCSLLASGVAVESEDHLAAGAVIREQPPRNLDVVRTKRRAAGRHSCAHPGKVARHDIRVTLHNNQLTALGDLPLGEVDPVEHQRLLVERGFRSIEVFGALVFLEQFAGAKAHGVSGNIPNGPDEPAPEAVIDALSIVRRDAEHTGQLQLVMRKALGGQMAEEPVPALGGKANTKLFCRGAVKPPLLQERTAGGSARSQQLVTIELSGDLVGIQQPLTLAGLLPAGTRSTILIPQLESDPGGEFLNGFGEGRVIHLLDKRNHIAALAAAKAVVGAHLRAHVEGRRTLIVEGAQALVGAHTGGFQRDVTVNHFLDIGALPDLIDVFALDESGHENSLSADGDPTVPGLHAGLAALRRPPEFPTRGRAPDPRRARAASAPNRP